LDQKQAAKNEEAYKHLSPGGKNRCKAVVLRLKAANFARTPPALTNTLALEHVIHIEQTFHDFIAVSKQNVQAHTYINTHHYLHTHKSQRL